MKTREELIQDKILEITGKFIPYSDATDIDTCKFDENILRCNSLMSAIVCVEEILTSIEQMYEGYEEYEFFKDVLKELKNKLK